MHETCLGSAGTTPEMPVEQTCTIYRNARRPRSQWPSRLTWRNADEVLISTSEAHPAPEYTGSCFPLTLPFTEHNV